MLDFLTFKFGPSPGESPLRIAPGSMTVLVGPNNSGKSLTLREIRDVIVHSKSRAEIDDWDSYFKVIASISPRLPQQGDLRDAILTEIRADLKPFRGALAAVKLKPADVFGKFELSHLGPIMEQAVQLGQLQQLAQHHKIDPALLDFDWAMAKAQPTLLQAAASFLREAIRFLDKNEAVLASVSAQTPTDDGANLVSSGAIKLDGYLHHYSERHILLDGRTRLSLTDPDVTHSLHEPAQNVIMRLYYNEAELEELRKYVFDAFQRHLSVDLTALVKCRFVLSDKPAGPYEKAFGTPEAKKYFKDAEDIASSSDGFKSYVGLHATLLSADYRVILLDEPEAFLHPPLARLLGYNLTKLAEKRGATIVAATHSPFFLMGCLEASRSTTVVRLNYHDNRTPTARSLSADTLHRVMNDPLLRSSRVLNALFHRSAVVCEGDSDQAFYDEINERLRREHEGGNTKERYLRDCLFINSHGKDSIDRLMGMLRTMGIPAAGVVDLDVLQDAGGATARLLTHAGAGQAAALFAGQLRSKVRNYFAARAKAQLEQEGKFEADKIKPRTERLIKRGGVDNRVDGRERKDLEDFVHLMKRHGIFVPLRGEVETWLPELRKGDVEKKRWLGEIFTAMGSLEEPSGYLKPESGDVWDFMREIARWVDEHAFAVEGPEEPAQLQTPALSVADAEGVAHKPNGND